MILHAHALQVMQQAKFEILLGGVVGGVYMSCVRFIAPQPQVKVFTFQIFFPREFSAVSCLNYGNWRRRFVK